MSDLHKLELLKALREHGQTIRKFAGGGMTEGLGFDQAPGAGAGTSLAPVTAGQGGTGGQGGNLGLNSTFQAQGANLTPGTNINQLNGAYNAAQYGLTGQQNLMNALNAQNAIQNQSANYAALGNVANGQGPNPAQAMLNQATGQNVANQAALMAGQRGASSNVGLIARQAAQTGAQTQQNAVGQAASIQAQQQLNALNAQAGVAQNQVQNLANATTGFSQGQQNEQNILQNANSSLNSNISGVQNNINSTNAQIAQGNQNSQNQLLGGILQGAAIGAIALAKDGGEVKDGKVTPPDKKDEKPKKFAAGGQAQPFNVFAPTVPVGPTAPGAATAPASGGGAAPQSSAGQYLSGQGSAPAMAGSASNPFSMAGATFGAALGKLGGATAGQTQDQAEEGYLDADAQLGVAGVDNPEVTTAGEGSLGEGLEAAAKGGLMGALKKGGKVPGKPKVGGAVNTEKNDTVPALLSAGEIVLPRSVTQSSDPVGGAAKFVAALMKKNGGKKMACGGPVKMADGGSTSALGIDDSESAVRERLSSTMGKIKDAGSFLFGPSTPYQGGPSQSAQPEAAAPTPGNTQPATPAPTNVSLGQQAPVNSMQAAYQNTPYDPYQGLNTQIAGVQGEAKAIGNLESQKADIIQNNQKTLQDINAQAQQNAWNNQVETQNMIEDMKQSKIDPNAYINNMGSGQKVATAIGLLLGGMGGGILKNGSNPAMDFLNKQIERDVSAQQANIENKKTVFNAMQHLYGNQMDATKMTQAFYMAKMDNEIKEAAARSGSPLAIARAQQLTGPLQQQLQQLHFEVGMRQAAMNAMKNGGDAAAAIPYLVPKDQQPKAVEAYGKIKELNSLENDMNNSSKDLSSKFMNGLLSPNESASARNAYSGAIQKISEGRYNGEAADKLTTAMLPQTMDTADTIRKKDARRKEFFEAFRKEPKAVLDMHFVPSPQAPATFNQR